MYVTNSGKEVDGYFVLQSLDNVVYDGLLLSD
ncbi:hypothetical protein NMY3_01793 [Candidatus Nitrosocosmicus oleophilus]|uniref:Uncharacterized protein n=1 Tax=Candidatus Nitrosocosmicus oleophilus TaxID=1353260 RepID=A0A654LZX4_9ARCH|nr:hypothetical protein NMY3_01793 [Candidatus Nitrosocosmicus oleophilus]